MEACPIARLSSSLARAIVRASRSLLFGLAGLVIGASLLVLALPASAALTGADIYAPPARGLFAYNGFIPPLIPGTSYVDPVFGETVRRLTTDHGRDDLYARNMWWN